MTTPASQAVADILRQPDDLHKLASYRKKLLKEKAALDAKLQEGVKAQLDATRDALLKLQASRAAVGMIREEMMAVERLKGGTEEGEAFEKITRVRLSAPSPLLVWIAGMLTRLHRYRRYIETLRRRPRWSTTFVPCRIEWTISPLYSTRTAISETDHSDLHQTSCLSISSFNSSRHSGTRRCIRRKREIRPSGMF